jgi:hypothetical protein
MLSVLTVFVGSFLWCFCKQLSLVFMSTAVLGVYLYAAVSGMLMLSVLTVFGCSACFYLYTGVSGEAGLGVAVNSCLGCVDAQGIDCFCMFCLFLFVRSCLGCVDAQCIDCFWVFCLFLFLHGCLG